MYLPRIINCPHVDWRSFVIYLTEQMNKSGEYLCDYHYVNLCLENYLWTSDEWNDDVCCLKLYYPSQSHNTLNHILSPFIKEFFKTQLNDCPLSFFYLDAD